MNHAYPDGIRATVLQHVFHAAASATKDLSLAFTPWSHVVALIYQQLTKTESLNGVCDAARLHASQWQELRGAVPPRRNTFSNAEGEGLVDRGTPSKARHGLLAERS